MSPSLLSHVSWVASLPWSYAATATYPTGALISDWTPVIDPLAVGSVVFTHDSPVADVHASRSLTTLSTSSDGRTWQTVDAFRGANADVALGLAASDEALWILAGSSGPPDGWTGPYLPTV